MRKMISGLVAAAAVMAANAPAMACGLYGCSPCAGYADTCGYGQGVYAYAGQYGVGYERLADTSPQYYYVNQGPTYSGPGAFAPLPTYQEAAVSGWGAYSRPYYYPYDGGRYASATSHYYDGAGVEGPAIYSYRWHGRHGHGVQRGMRYGGARFSAAPRSYGPKILHRYY